MFSKICRRWYSHDLYDVHGDRVIIYFLGRDRFHRGQTSRNIVVRAHRSCAVRALPRVRLVRPKAAN